jgi:Tol biopolymer transport system component
MNIDGTNLTPLTSNSSIDDRPTCSPDGTKIAFTSDRAGSVKGKTDVWVRRKTTGPDS